MPLIPVSNGELLDRISILQIKTERIKDPTKLANVWLQLGELMSIMVLADSSLARPNILTLMRDLRSVNEELWEIEDDLRDMEAREDFDEVFVESARSVYRLNDKRHSIKRQIDEVTYSDFKEEKCYSAPH